MLAVLSVWVLAPLVVLLVDGRGQSFTGVIGLDPYDQFQELAWIREMGAHGLSSNLFGMTSGSHVFLQPMWLISGALWRLGLSLPAAYLLWVPVAVLSLWAGLLVLARRMGATPWQQVAILTLALFFTSPIGWLHLPSTPWVTDMQMALSDASAALQPWLALHTAVALGVMAAVIVGLLRLGEVSDGSGPSLRLIVWTSLGAALVSWLHSWQGITLLLIIAGLFVVRRPRRIDRSLVLPLGACALPLLYQFLLTRFDDAWRLAEHQNARPDLMVLTPVLAVLGPLLAAALVSVVRRWPLREDTDRLLVLWVVAAALTYRFDHEFPPHALQGVAIPLTALAVRGWPNTRPALALGTAAILALTVPGLVYFAKLLSPTLAANREMFFHTADERAALSFLGRQHSGGGVLAPVALALAVPGFTDLPVWDGHQVWTPNSPLRVDEATRFYGGALSRDQAARFVKSTHVSWVLGDCSASGGALGPQVLRSLGARVYRFGCAEVAKVPLSGR